MPEQHDLDPQSILAALGITGAAEAKPVSGGADTAIWRISHGGQLYALRVFRAEQAATYRREIAAMRAAAAGELPVPAIYAAGSWRDRPALLLGWCEGEPLIRTLQRQPGRIWRLGQEFGRMQAKIHAVAPAPDPELPPDDWIVWAGANEAALHQRLRAVAARATRLLHLDYHPLNVMTDGRRMTAVLDWANARVGDPRADVARSHSILAIEPSWPRGPHIAVFRQILARAYLRGYEQVTGPLGDLALFYAWAGAVMLRDLAPRAARPGSGLRLERVRHWTSTWKRRAGLPL
ncbi:MAG TPA: phosphotransferase [Roseiflexaceae bacterium]|nr:phosphotransferase [Roseiflexaceae bacterium]